MQVRQSDRDPLVVLADLVSALVKAIRELDETRLRRREGPEKWSILEVIQHLADNELFCGWLVRHILTCDTPQTQDYDQDVWARELRYNDMNLDGVFDQLRALRSANLRLFRSLGGEQLERCGVYGESGTVSVGKIIRALAEHDLQHLRQIERIKKLIT